MRDVTNREVGHLAFKLETL